jgi:hypothetical protein
MNTETALLDEGGVKVTTARFIANGQTFALRNITSVKMDNAGSLRWPIVWAIFAVSAFGGSQASSDASNGALVTGIVFASLAVLQWRKNSAKAIILVTSGKEEKAYKTHDKDHARRVLQALNDAIARQ